MSDITPTAEIMRLDIKGVKFKFCQDPPVLDYVESIFSNCSKFNICQRHSHSIRITFHQILFKIFFKYELSCHEYYSLHSAKFTVAFQVPFTQTYRHYSQYLINIFSKLFIFCFNFISRHNFGTDDDTNLINMHFSPK